MPNAPTILTEAQPHSIPVIYDPRYPGWVCADFPLNSQDPTINAVRFWSHAGRDFIPREIWYGRVTQQAPTEPGPLVTVFEETRRIPGEDKLEQINGMPFPRIENGMLINRTPGLHDYLQGVLNEHFPEEVPFPRQAGMNLPAQGMADAQPHPGLPLMLPRKKGRAA